MPIATAIVGAVSGITSNVLNFVGQNKARKDRDALIEDELRLQRESTLQDPSFYAVCVDTYEQTGSITNLCKDAGFKESEIASKKLIKDEKTRKLVVGIVVSIVLAVVTYFLIIKK